MPVYRGSTVIHSGGAAAVNGAPFGQLIAVTAASIVANQAYYQPVVLSAPATVDGMRFRLAVSTAGLLDLGIYDDNAGAPGDLLGSTGIEAGNTTTTVQELPLTATLELDAGTYHFALRGSTTGIQPWYAPVTSASGGVLVDPEAPTFYKTHVETLGSSVPLPATATPTQTNVFLPMLVAVGP
jgi:hypothetical protein